MKSRTRGVRSPKKKIVSIYDPQTNRYNRVEIRSISNKELWTLFKEFINSLVNGQEFSRKELIDSMYVSTVSDAMRRFETAADHYRLYACHVGFLEHVGRGKYKKLCNMPIDLTTTDLKRFAYNEAPWQDWFIPKEQRLKALMKKYGGRGEVV